MRLAAVRNGIVTVAFAAAGLSGQSASKTRPLSYTKFTLPNGLVTIVNEDHSSPIVGIDLMYHVGAKDEVPGHQEVAHMCEHWMFEGSPHWPKDAKAFYESFGGTSRGWGATGEDKTDLFETIPSNYLETALWFEADRMAAPAFHTDSQTFALVRAAVTNERRQNITDPVFGSDGDAIYRTLFPENQPYSWTAGDVIPSLEKVPAAEVRAFCIAHYVPSNAVLAISGDANPAQVRAWVQKYFGKIPRGSAPHAVVPQATLTSEKRVVQEDARARAPALRVAWVGAGYTNPDKVAMQALAFVLAGDRRSGLAKSVRYDRRLATQVAVGNYDEELSGEFIVIVNGVQTSSLTAIEQAIDSAVASVRDHPPPASVLADFRGLHRLTSMKGLEQRMNRADTLAQGEGWAHDPVHYAKELDQAKALSPDDVQRAARKYLTTGHVILSLIPAGKFEMISKPDIPYTRLDNAGFPVTTPSGEHHEPTGR